MLNMVNLLSSNFCIGFLRRQYLRNATSVIRMPAEKVRDRQFLHFDIVEPARDPSFQGCALSVDRDCLEPARVKTIIA